MDGDDDYANARLLKVLLTRQRFVIGDQRVESLCLHGAQEVTVALSFPAHVRSSEYLVAGKMPAEAVWHIFIKQHAHRRGPFRERTRSARGIVRRA